MSAVQIPSPTRRSSSTKSRRGLGRWMVTFLGFPLGGVVPWLVLGPVDSLVPALVGGLVTGAILGAIQAWGLGRTGSFLAQWTTATAVGLMVGLGAGAMAVDYKTDLTALVIQGALSGLGVGVAQSLVLLSRVGNRALAWPLFLAASWAAGWAITTSAGIGVDEQFTVFGASGAIVVALLTIVLPVVLRRSEANAS